MNDQWFQGILIALISAAALLFGQRLVAKATDRAAKLKAETDARAAKTGDRTESRSELNDALASLRADNVSIRDDLRRCEDRYDALAAAHDGLRREVNRMYRKYGENGEATP